jgi:hypothetical protein
MQKLIIIASFLLCSFSPIFAQNDYEFEAIYTYNFTKYINWPIEKGNNVVIGILGNGAVLNAFKKMAKSKSSANRQFLVKQLTSGEQVGSCNIIFICKQHDEDFRSIIKEVYGKPVLLITEDSQYAKRGSGINFLKIGGKLKFEINQNMLQKSGLKVSNSLLQLAVSTN